MANAGNKITDELIEKALQPNNGPDWLAAQLRHKDVPRDVATKVAHEYATLSGSAVAPILEMLDTAYRKLVPKQPQAVPVFKTVSLYETFHREFPEGANVIERFLPAGASLLSADPKSGKSFLCLQAAVCVAQNRCLFGHYHIKRPGPVLYLALEDGERRINMRMHDLGMTDRDLQNVTMVYEISPSLSTPEGQRAIEQELQRQRDTGNPYVLYVVDTLAAACDEMGGGSDIFRKQYQEMKYFQKIAERFNLAALVSTHNKKGEAKGALEKMGGTYGRAAAVSGNMILEKQADRTILQIRSRDTEDADIPLKWRGKQGGWGLLTEVEVQMKDHDRLVYETVKRYAPISVSKVAERLGKDRGNTSRRMREMATRGELTYDAKQKKYAVALVASHLLPVPDDFDETEGFMQ